MPDTDKSMITLSKKIELDCQLYIKTGTESRKRTTNINAVTNCVNHNTNKTSPPPTTKQAPTPTTTSTRFTDT